MAIIAARSWNRFVVRRLSISPELLGATHRFKYSGKQVEVVLPNEERNADGTLRNDKVGRGSYRIVDGKEVPISYWVHSVDILLDLDEALDIPDEALQKPPVQRELFSESQISRLNALSNEYLLITKAVFQHWLQVLRWKTRMPFIGEPEIAREESGWATYLISTETNHRFWGRSEIVSIVGESVVTEAQWEATQSALDANLAAPPWFEFIFEAHQRLNSNDMVAAVLNAAIGFELIVRHLLALHLSSETAQQRIVTTLLDLTNLRTITNHKNLMKFWNTDWKKHYDGSAFDQLMNCRDKIMHTGGIAESKKQDWRKILNKLMEFAYFVDEHIHI